MARELAPNDLEKAREAITILGLLVNRSSSGSVLTNPSNQSHARSSASTSRPDNGETELNHTKSINKMWSVVGEACGF